MTINWKTVLLLIAAPMIGVTARAEMDRQCRLP